MPREIPLKDRHKVLALYFQGLSYDEIAEQTMLSKGSVANIVSMAKEGKFRGFSGVREQIDALRELSVELRKKNLKLGQALLGLSFFERLSKLGIEPDVLDRWIKMCYEISSPDYPIEESMRAALRLKELEHEKGVTYEELTEDYEAKTKVLSDIERRISELGTSHERLSSEVDSLSKEKRSIETKIKELEDVKELISERVKKWKQEEEDLKNEVAEIQKRHKVLKLESQRLENRTVALREEIGEREGILSGLRLLGFSEAELLRLKDKLEELAENSDMKPEELRKNLFLDLDSYTDVLGFRSESRRLRQEVKRLRTEKEGLEEENKNLQKAIRDLGNVSDQAVQHVKKEEGKIVSSMDNFVSKARSTLNESVLAARSGVNQLLEDIESAKQEVKGEMKRATSQAVEYGKAMGRMEKVVGEREELVKLFGILGDVSTIPKDIAVVAPLVVLARFHEWGRTTNDLKNKGRILSSVEEVVHLLRLEAT